MNTHHQTLKPTIDGLTADDLQTFEFVFLLWVYAIGNIVPST